MIEVFPPVEPIIADVQHHDALREEKEDERSQAEFFGDRDVEVHV